MKTIHAALWVIMSLLVLDVAFAANHRSGLHLQLPSQTIDLKKSDIEEMQIFQSSPGNASALIRLRSTMAEKVYKVTQQAVGQQMLWIWNGRVVGVQKLAAPINEYLTVPNLTASEAEDLTSTIAKW